MTQEEEYNVRAEETKSEHITKNHEHKNETNCILSSQFKMRWERERQRKSVGDEEDRGRQRKIEEETEEITLGVRETREIQRQERMNHDSFIIFPNVILMPILSGNEEWVSQRLMIVPLFYLWFLLPLPWFSPYILFLTNHHRHHHLHHQGSLSLSCFVNMQWERRLWRNILIHLCRCCLCFFQPKSSSSDNTEKNYRGENMLTLLMHDDLGIRIRW